jgi:hypothetical protein
MNKNLFFAFLFCLLAMVGKAQTFSAGWYIIKENAQYSVILPSGQDVRTEQALTEIVYDEQGYPIYTTPPSIEMATGEVVFAFEQTKEFYFAYDPQGRMLAFKGTGSLEKVPAVANAGVGFLLENVELLSGETLKTGGFYWIVGQDIAKGTVSIQTDGGKKHELPKNSIVLYSTNLRKHIKENFFETAR